MCLVDHYDNENEDMREGEEKKMCRGGMNRNTNDDMSSSSDVDPPPPNWASVASSRSRIHSVTVLQFNLGTIDERVTSVFVHPSVRQNMTVDIMIFRRRLVIGELAPLIAAAVATDATDLRLTLPGEDHADLWVEAPRILHVVSNDAPTFMEVILEDSRLTSICDLIGALPMSNSCNKSRVSQIEECQPSYWWGKMWSSGCSQTRLWHSRRSS